MATEQERNTRRRHTRRGSKERETNKLNQKPSQRIKTNIKSKLKEQRIQIEIRSIKFVVVLRMFASFRTHT